MQRYLHITHSALRYNIRLISVVLLVCSCFIHIEARADSTSAMLLIRPVADEFFDNARDGRDQDLEGYDDELIVIGMIDIPDFAIQGSNQVALFDPNDSPIPLIVDTSSLYSEFDDGVYNSMRIMFRVRESVVEKGGLRLVWGNEISANNTQVDQISIYREDKDRYRTFNWEAQPEGDDGGSYAATVEVIVDDYADTYYLWYLLPMVLIFTLLFVKKIALK